MSNEKILKTYAVTALNPYTRRVIVDCFTCESETVAKIDFFCYRNFRYKIISVGVVPYEKQ